MPQKGNHSRRSDPSQSPSDQHGLTPDETQFWHARRADVIAFKLILGAVHVDDSTSTHHLWNGSEFPAPLPAGRDRTDVWTWTAASTCPLFHRDLNAFTLIQAKIGSDGIEDIYIAEILAAFDLDPDLRGLRHPDVFKLLTAPPEVRLFCAMTTYPTCKESGLLPPDTSESTPAEQPAGRPRCNGLP